MFKSKAMSKVELVVLEQEVVPVTEALAASGVFHVAPTDYMCPDDGTCQTNEWQEWAASFARLERRILAIMEALQVDSGPPPRDTPHLIGPEVAEMDVEHLEAEAQAPVRELEEERHHLEQLQRYVSQLTPLLDLDVDLDRLRNMRYIYMLPGTIPAANVERLRTSLEHIPHVLVMLREREHLATVVLFGMQRDSEILSRAARSAYLNPFTLPDVYRGTPAEAIEALRSGIERTQSHIAEYEVTIRHLREMRINHLRHLLWRVRASRALAETIASYGRLRYSYLVAGWVPARLVPQLEERLQEVSDNVLIEVVEPRPEDNGQVPVSLDNPPLLQAFQDLVTNYGQPRYGELDPTPIMALTFPLVFGVMFGDVGHGLTLALLGLILARGRIRQLRGLVSLGPVLIASGAVSALFGFLYGSVFGFESFLRPLWIRPLENVFDILLVSIGLGAALLSLGMIYNVLNSLIARKWGHMLLDHNGLAGLLFYWSSIGLGLGLLTDMVFVSNGLLATLLGVAALAIIGAEPLARLIEGEHPVAEDGLGTALIQGFFELFETTIGFLSNTLSYVRMGAFAVAHGGLSLVVFMLARIVDPSQGVWYWLVFLLGNLFVIGFEGMIVGIQTLRLEYYEFFSKFFSGSGLRHRPLTLIAKEEN